MRLRPPQGKGPLVERLASRSVFCESSQPAVNGLHERNVGHNHLHEADNQIPIAAMNKEHTSRMANASRGYGSRRPSD